MEHKQATILIVDESKQQLGVHATTLRGQGYEVITAGNGEEALLLVEVTEPDLFLIDTGMKDMDGYVLCERLKEDSRLLNVPVIFVAEKTNPEAIDRGYSAGGVDYIVKPCHLSEFLAKIRTHISLYHLLLEVQHLREAAIDANPLTHLPGNNIIVKTIQTAIDENRDMAVVYTDLDNFKSYNDAYGFSAGDDVLLFCAEVLQTALNSLCVDTGFLGHVGGDDFVMMVPADKVEIISEAITRTFDEGIADFYDEVDRRRGHIIAHDRTGQTVQFPFVAISLGGVNLRRRKFTRYVEVATVCAEVKHKAKTIDGSTLVLDQRDQIEKTEQAEPDTPLTSPTVEVTAAEETETEADTIDEAEADDALAALTDL